MDAIEKIILQMDEAAQAERTSESNKQNGQRSTRNLNKNERR
jgi:hypothetical protein